MLKYFFCEGEQLKQCFVLLQICFFMKGISNLFFKIVIQNNKNLEKRTTKCNEDISEKKRSFFFILNIQDPNLL